MVLQIVNFSIDEESNVLKLDDLIPNPYKSKEMIINHSTNH